MKMSKISRVLLVLLVSIAGIGGSASMASAATCARGTACLWTDSSYKAGWGGVKYSVSANHGSLYGTRINDGASSGWANGGSCAATRFYSDTNYGLDLSTYGQRRFVLNSQTLVKANYRDPYFKNGAGLNSDGSSHGWAGQNWNDQVSSWKFTAC